MMLAYLIPLLACYLDSDLISFWYLPYFAGYIVISVPGIIRSLTKWR